METSKRYSFGRAARRSNLIQIDVLLYLVESGEGRTELELARAIHGADGYQPQVNQDLDSLVRSEKIKRIGAGGQADPHRYYAVPKRG
jgi:hypothetical protein